MPMVAFVRLVGVTVMVGQTGASVKTREPAQAFASVAVRVKVWLVVAVGVPLMAPVLVLRLKPAGRAPLLTA
jgi:hypothetical protein